MHENTDHDSLESEIKRRNFVRAVLVAERTALSEEEIRGIRFKALGQMSAIYRNVYGTRYLAQQYGYSMEEVKQLLEQFAHELKIEGNMKPLEPCYDYNTGKYLSFNEWMDHYIKS